MDVAQINIDTSSSKTDLECEMPIYGTQNFTFYKPHNEWFLQYLDYPIVKASVGIDLYKGLGNIPYQIKILPATGFKDELNAINITNFFVGMIAK